jgi:HEAT repeat protein
MERDFRKRLQAIIERQTKEHMSEVAHSVESLVKMGVDSSKDLVEVLQGNSLQMTRLTACWLLGQLRYKRAVKPLLKVFESEGKLFIWESAKSLGLIKSKRAVLPLISFLASRNAERRAASSYALGLLKDVRAVEPLVKVISNKNESNKVRGLAAEALGQIGDRKAVEPLLKCLNEPEAEIRFWSAFALGQLGDIRAVPALKRIAKKDTSTFLKYGRVSDEAKLAIDTIQGRKP